MISISQFTVAHFGSEPLVSNATVTIPQQLTYFLLSYNGSGKSSFIRNVFSALFTKTKGVSIPLKTAYIPQDIPDISLEIAHPTYWDIQFEVVQQMSEYFDGDISQSLLEWYSDVCGDIPPTFTQDFEHNLLEIGVSSSHVGTWFSAASPGTKKKIILSALFASQPDVILADEFTNHLDSNAISVLSSWIKKSTAAKIIIDHNQSFISQCGSHFLFIPQDSARKLKAYSDMTYEEFLEKLEQEKENQLLEQKRAQVREEQLRAAIEMQQRRVEVFGIDVGKAVQNLKHKLDREVNQREALNYIAKDPTVSFVNRKVKTDKPKSDLLVSIKNLEYKIGPVRSQKVDEFAMYKQDRIRITGKNGSGKSALLSLMESATNGVLQQHPQFIQGVITIGTTVQPSRIFKLEQVTAYASPQKISDFIQERITIETVKIQSFLKKIGFECDADDNIAHLSLGQLIRLQLAILGSRLEQTDIIILDEPGNFLDVFTQQALARLTQSFKGGILLITHDDVLADAIGYYETFELK